jgi:nucleoside-diphosphate-sugar epimerase
LHNAGYRLRCWHRESSDLSGLDGLGIDWVLGELGDKASAQRLLDGAQVLVHSGFYRENPGFQNAAGDIETFVQRNVLGSVQLFDAAHRAELERTVYISSCSVHEEVLDDRPLDETHPLWARSHYGAHKAAVEKFVHSYGLGHGMPICAIRPCAIYGVDDPVEQSKFYDLVRQVAAGNDVECTKGSKCVHVGDVAEATLKLLQAPAKKICGQAYAAFDRYISDFEVAEIAKKLSGSSSRIAGQTKSPKHTIETGKIQKLGVQFGGDNLLMSTIAELLR